MPHVGAPLVPSYDQRSAVLLVFANAAGNGQSQRIADAFDRDPIEDLLEEPGHDHANRFLAGEAAALGVEDQFFVDATAGRTVRAADVVRFDLQTGNRIGPGCRRTAADCRCADSRRFSGHLRIDLDHAPPDGSRPILQGRLVQEIAGALRRFVMLQRVVGQMLPVLGEHHAVHLAMGPSPIRRRAG